MATVHVYPVNDLIAHELDGETCVCGPALEYVEGEEEDGWLVKHAALDGRELCEKRELREKSPPEPPEPPPPGT